MAIQSFKTLRGPNPDGSGDKVEYQELMGMQEAWHGVESNANTSTRLLLVDYGLHEDLVKAMLPDVYLGPLTTYTYQIPGTVAAGPLAPGQLYTVSPMTNVTANWLKIRRLLPEPHPTKPLQFASSAELVDAKGVPMMVQALVPGAGDRDYLNVSSNNIPLIPGKAVIRMDYKTSSFTSPPPITDAQVDAFGPTPAGELMRWTSRKIEPSVESLQIGGNGFVFFNDGFPLGQEAPVRTLPLVTYRLTLHSWPAVPSSIASFVNAPDRQGLNTLQTELAWVDTGGPGKALEVRVTNRNSGSLVCFQVHLAWKNEAPQPDQTTRGKVACLVGGETVSLPAADSAAADNPLQPGQCRAFLLAGGELRILRSLTASLSPECFSLFAQHHEMGVFIVALKDGRTLAAFLERDAA